MKNNFKKKIIKVCGMIVACIIIGTSIFVMSIRKEENKAIGIIENAKMTSISKDVTYKQAFDKALFNTNYTTYKDSDGNRMVYVTGKKLLKEKNKIADFRFEYMVDTENGNFKLVKSSYNGFEMNEVESLIFMIQSISQFDSNTNF